MNWFSENLISAFKRHDLCLFRDDLLKSKIQRACHMQKLLKLWESRKKSLNLKCSRNKGTSGTCMKKNLLAFPYPCMDCDCPPPITFEIQPPNPLFIFSSPLFCLCGTFSDFYSRLESNTFEVFKKSKSWSN